eukprot:scaffold3290_cov165-Ochromonas_danica.AAC.10
MNNKALTEIVLALEHLKSYCEGEFKKLHKIQEEQNLRLASVQTTMTAMTTMLEEYSSCVPKKTSPALRHDVVTPETIKSKVDSTVRYHLLSAINDSAVLKEIRDICSEDNYSDEFRKRGLSFVVGRMLSPRMQNKKGYPVAMKEQEIYDLHGKLRKIFTNFIGNIFVYGCGSECFSGGYAKRKILLDQVAAVIFQELFRSRLDLSFWTIDWIEECEEHDNSNCEKRDDQDEQQDRKRPRREESSGPTIQGTGGNNTNGQKKFLRPDLLLQDLSLAVLRGEIQRVVQDRINYARRTSKPDLER